MVVIHKKKETFSNVIMINELKPWQLYLLVFLLFSVLNYSLRQIAGAEWQDANLLVNVVINGLLTVGFIVVDCMRRNYKSRKAQK